MENALLESLGCGVFHGATFDTVWERCTESRVREDSRHKDQLGWRCKGLGKVLDFRLENILCFFNK